MLRVHERGPLLVQMLLRVLLRVRVQVEGHVAERARRHRPGSTHCQAGGVQSQPAWCAAAARQAARVPQMLLQQVQAGRAVAAAAAAAHIVAAGATEQLWEEGVGRQQDVRQDAGKAACQGQAA